MGNFFENLLLRAFDPLALVPANSFVQERKNIPICATAEEQRVIGGSLVNVRDFHFGVYNCVVNDVETEGKGQLLGWVSYGELNSFWATYKAVEARFGRVYLKYSIDSKHNDDAPLNLRDCKFVTEDGLEFDQREFSAEQYFNMQEVVIQPSRKRAAKLATKVADGRMEVVTYKFGLRKKTNLLLNQQGSIGLRDIGQNPTYEKPPKNGLAKDPVGFEAGTYVDNGSRYSNSFERVVEGNVNTGGGLNVFAGLRHTFEGRNGLSENLYDFGVGTKYRVGGVDVGVSIGGNRDYRHDNIGRLRLRVDKNFQGRIPANFYLQGDIERPFASGRDEADFKVEIGSDVRLTKRLNLRIGIDGQDLEGLVDTEEKDGGARLSVLSGITYTQNNLRLTAGGRLTFHPSRNNTQVQKGLNINNEGTVAPAAFFDAQVLF